MKTLSTLFILIVLAICAVVSPLRAAEDVGLLIFNHRIAIGMTYGNVQSSWGKPEKVDRSTSNYGVREYWFFKSGALVVFENGRVVSFHQ